MLSLLAVAVTLSVVPTPVPPFDVGMSPDPQAGVPATLVVAFPGDVAPEALEDALAVVWADDYEGRPVPASVTRLPVEWTESGPRRYEGQVIFPRPGRWLLVALPDLAERPPLGYADTIAVDVGARPPPAGWMLVAIAAAAVGLGLARRGSKSTRAAAPVRSPRRSGRTRAGRSRRRL